MKRIRDHGAEIFKYLRDMINAGFNEYYKDPDAEPLTYKRKKQDPVVLDSFGNALFFPESNIARRHIPGLDDLVGLWEVQSGVFESRPLEALMIYENYEVKGGEEFLSDLLFRVRS
jgi:hypothetical protein